MAKKPKCGPNSLSFLLAYSALENGNLTNGQKNYISYPEVTL